MEQNARVKYCLERLEMLRYQTPKIARVLDSADEVLRSQPIALGQGKASDAQPFESMRTALLDNSLKRLKEAKALFKPLVDSATHLNERIDSISSRLDSTRKKLHNYVKAAAGDDIRRLSDQISLTEKRLSALNRLMEQINPSLHSIEYDTINADSQPQNSAISHIEHVLDTAESLIASKGFCDSLNELEYLKGSPVLLEASQRITANMDKVCELLFLRLQRASRTLSNVICRAFEEASVIALKHSNSFVPPIPQSNHLDDEFGMASILNPRVDPDSSISLRALKLLQMRPTYLYHFVNGMRDILGQISLKHFAAYASSCTVELCNRSAAVRSVLGHLEHNVAYIRGCVEGLYSNAGLPFYYAESNEHGAKLLKASDYLGTIIELLANPLEAKLNKVMVGDATRGLDGLMTCNGVVDMFRSIHIISSYTKKMEELLATPWSNAEQQFGMNIGDEDDQPECETDVEEGNEGSLSNRSRLEQKEVTIVLKLRAIHEEWHQKLLGYIDEAIGVPLAEEPSCQVDLGEIVDIAAPHIIHTICEFIEDIIQIQSQHDSSQDLNRILEITVKPAVNWCKKSSENYGEYLSAYLINCLAKLQKALDNDISPESLRELLKSEMNTQMETTIHELSMELRDYLGLSGIQNAPSDPKETLKKISALIFGDAILECNLASTRKLKLIEERSQKTIKSRLYKMLAEDYASICSDKNASQVQHLIEFTAQL